MGGPALTRAAHLYSIHAPVGQRRESAEGLRECEHQVVRGHFDEIPRVEWVGGQGKGRALSVGEVKFSGMVVPSVQKVEYIVNLKRTMMRKLTLGIADGVLKADGEPIYSARDLRVGLFEPEAAKG